MENWFYFEQVHQSQQEYSASDIMRFLRRNCINPNFHPFFKGCLGIGCVKCEKFRHWAVFFLHNPRTKRTLNLGQHSHPWYCRHRRSLTRQKTDLDLFGRGKKNSGQVTKRVVLFVCRCFRCESRQCSKSWKTREVGVRTTRELNGARSVVIRRRTVGPIVFASVGGFDPGRNLQWSFCPCSTSPPHITHLNGLSISWGARK